MDASDLTAEEELEAQRIADIVMARARLEAIQIGRLLATRKNSELFGETEFTLRDAVHRIGASALETALEERKKRGTKGLLSSAPPVKKRRDSKATTRRP
jgi:hypothetical protein